MWKKLWRTNVLLPVALVAGIVCYAAGQHASILKDHASLSRVRHIYSGVRITWVGDNGKKVVFWANPDGDPAKPEVLCRGNLEEGSVNELLIVYRGRQPACEQALMEAG